MNTTGLRVGIGSDVHRLVPRAADAPPLALGGLLGHADPHRRGLVAGRQYRPDRDQLHRARQGLEDQELSRRLSASDCAAGGIGRAICDAFVDVGDKVVATDVRSFASQDSVVGLACDVRSTASIARVIEECNRLGGIDVLVNCAGIMRRTDVLELSPELWDEVFDVNVKGPLLCSQAAARSMIDGGRAGSIIHVGSINAEKVFTETVAYCSSKGALHAMGRSMALALAPHGIRVDMVAPGAIDDTVKGEETARLRRLQLHRPPTARNLRQQILRVQRRTRRRLLVALAVGVAALLGIEKAFEERDRPQRIEVIPHHLRMISADLHAGRPSRARPRQDRPARDQGAGSSN